MRQAGVRHSVRRGTSKKKTVQNREPAGIFQPASIILNGEFLSYLSVIKGIQGYAETEVNTNKVCAASLCLRCDTNIERTLVLFMQ